MQNGQILKRFDVFQSRFGDGGCLPDQGDFSRSHFADDTGNQRRPQASRLLLPDDGSGRLPLVTDVAEIAGTPCYMAPEMFFVEVDKLGPRTDVYLLGAILYEFLVGRPPHDGETLSEVADQIQRTVRLPTGDGPPYDDLLDRLDGVLLTGGRDIAPSLYGEGILNPTVDIDAARDAFELPMIRAAVERDVPILGICRGIQALNVALGGTLYQDIPSQLP